MGENSQEGTCFQGRYVKDEAHARKAGAMDQSPSPI